MKKACMISVVFLSMLFLASCQKEESKYLDKPYSDSQFETGNYTVINVYDKGKEKAVTKAFDVLHKGARKIETQEEGISELDKIKEAAGKQPVKVSKEVFQLIQQAVNCAKETDRAYEPAIGAITLEWAIGFSEAGKPTDEELKEAIALSNYQDIELNEANSTVYLKKAGMSLNLGGVGKAWLAQQILESLKADGVTSATVNLGGHIFVLGKNPKADSGEWTVDVEDTSRAESQQNENPVSLGKVKTDATTFITTSKYGRYLVVGNKIYSHLLDPRNGYPYDNGLLSVTIVGKDAINDDLMSNVLYDMGLEKGLKYVNEKLPNTEAIFVTDKKEIYVSDGLDGKFSLNENSGFRLVE